MKIITNFDLMPVDVYNQSSISITEGLGMVTEMEALTKDIIAGIKSNELYEDTLFIFHPPGPFVLDYTDGSYNSEKDLNTFYVVNKKGINEERETKMLFFDQGMLYFGSFQKMHQPHQRNFLSIIYQTLSKHNIQFQYKNNDFELLDGKKFLGAASIEGNGVRNESMIMSFNINLEKCQKALPKVFFEREYAQANGGKRVGNITEQYPKFKINKFIEDLIRAYN